MVISPYFSVNYINLNNPSLLSSLFIMLQDTVICLSVSCHTKDWNQLGVSISIYKPQYLTVAMIHCFHNNHHLFYFSEFWYPSSEWERGMKTVQLWHTDQGGLWWVKTNSHLERRKIGPATPAQCQKQSRTFNFNTHERWK